MNNANVLEEQKTYKHQTSNINIQVPGMVLRSNAGLPIHSKQAIVFVDANNWYHNVKKLFNPSDISITKIAKLICDNLKFNLQEVRWYSSIPDISDGEKTYYDHIHFLF